MFGFDFIDDSGFGPTIDRLVSEQPDDGLLPLVVTPNVDDIVQLSSVSHTVLLAAEQRARYVLPDGQPIVWTSRLMGTPLTARLPGSSLFPPLWARLVQDRRRVFLLASSDQVADGLTAEYTDLVSLVPPFFDAEDPTQVRAVIQEAAGLIRRHGPEFVFLGIGFPKQQRVALGLLEELGADDDPHPLFLLLGGSFNMHLDLSRRAPEWIQKLGVEWFYRFLLEPRRLFRRYFLTDTKFLPMMIREVSAARRARGTAA